MLPITGYRRILYQVEIGVLQTTTLTDACHGVVAPISPAKGAMLSRAKARLTTEWTKSGKFTEEKRVVAKRWCEVGQQMRAELAELEAWFVEHWPLEKKWRDQFK